MNGGEKRQGMKDPAASPLQARILIAESAELVRRGIRDVFASDHRFTVAGEVARPEDLVEACLELSPDLIFLGLAGDNGGDPGHPSTIAALKHTSRVAPFVGIIVVLAGGADGEILELVRAGAKGVLMRDAAASTLLEGAEDVLAGRAVLDPRLTRSLFDCLAADMLTTQVPRVELHPAVLRALSPRERQVLHSLAQGHRNKEIALQLGVSVGTVKTHLRHIFRKLTVADRTAAVLAALQVRLPEVA